MVESFSFDQLIASGEGRLFGADAGRLPLPPMLMFDRVTHIDDDGGATPIAFVRKARELESQIAAAKADERTAAINLERTVNRSTPTIANEWRALVSAALNFDYDARMKVRQLVADTFESIVIYHKGVMPDGKKVAPIDIVLIAKGGTPRMLRIDRNFRDGQPRKALIDAFRVIEDEDLVGRYRRRMAALLF